jgi:hypothetical protein
MWETWCCVLLHMTLQRAHDPSLLLYNPALTGLHSNTGHGTKWEEGRRCVEKTLLTTVAQSRFEVSAFQQLPHGAVTPHCSLEHPNGVSFFLPRAVLSTSVMGVFSLPVVLFLLQWSLSNCYFCSLLMCAHPEWHLDKLWAGPGVLPSSST